MSHSWRKAGTSMVAQRITGMHVWDGQSLLAMLADEDRNVRLAAVLSLPPDCLVLACSDPDPAVRFAVAERIAESDLEPFLDDGESVIRELACSRLTLAAERHVSRLMGESHSIVTVDNVKGPFS